MSEHKKIRQKQRPSSNNKKKNRVVVPSLENLAAKAVAASFPEGAKKLLNENVMEKVQRLMSKDDQIKYLHEYKLWDKKGRLESFQFFDADGKPHGKHTVFHPNGRVRMELHFTDGIRDGEWRWWDRKGELEFCEIYKDGKLWQSTYGSQVR